MIPSEEGGCISHFWAPLLILLTLTATNGNGSLATVTLLDPTPEGARFHQVVQEPAL
jgi:hypothetical protein